jgi:hypothetical protein
MVKMYLSPFCKLLLCFDSKPRITRVRPHPSHPSNWSLNYREYQANWTLTIRSFHVEDSSTNLFYFLVLFLLPTNLWNSICLVIIVHGGHGQVKLNALKGVASR